MSASVCFVSMDNINRVPYLERYLGCLDSSYDLIYWNRADIDEPISAEMVFAYCRACSVGGSGTGYMGKLMGYLGFKRYASKVLRENDYSMVVALTGNCAVLLSKILLTRYRSKYIVDIRDYWHEDLSWYHKKEQELIANSAATVISSPAYRSFLEEHPFLTMHNDQVVPDSWQPGERAHDPMVLACVGAAKNLAYDKRVIDYFANDMRFELRFIGRGYEALCDHVKTMKVENVSIEGAFPMKDTLSKYEGVDAILNMYGNHSPYFDFALSNKLYFAARLGLPILVCSDTYMAEVANEYSLGCSVDLDSPEEKQKVLRLYSSQALKERRKGSEQFLSMVEEQNEKTFARIRQLFREVSGSDSAL